MRLLRARLFNMHYVACMFYSGLIMALAYFITFTTYGSWLHGSEKGSVDDRHHVYGTPFVEPDLSRERVVRETLIQQPYVMDAAEREIVCRAIVELSSEEKWRLLAVHVRRNHVHVVVTADREPGRLMSDLKARASRELTSAGFDSAERKRWTRHGSTRHLFHESEVEAAIRYTLDEQGESMATYSYEPR